MSAIGRKQTFPGAETLTSGSRDASGMEITNELRKDWLGIAFGAIVTPEVQVELYRRKDNNGSLTTTLDQEKDGSIKLFYHDIGGQSRRTFGDDYDEAWVTISGSEVPKLALALLAREVRR